MPKQKMIIVLFLIVIVLNYGHCVIYKLNDFEYSQMPPVFHLDDYDQCLINPKGVYCTVDIDIVSDVPSDLLTLMKNYSEYSKKHYNHTQLHHGICLTYTCKEYFKANIKQDLKWILERCLNDSLWKNYELKSKISGDIYCSNEEKYIDISDIVMGVSIIVIVTINVIGSLYDIVLEKRKIGKGNKLLKCFSIQNNFKKLNPSYQCLDTREERLKGFHGLRTMTIMSVIYCHSMLLFALSPENPHYVEMLYDNILHFIFLNGTIVVQTFFLISGCLMAYKLEMYAERHEVTWTLIPKAIIMTWIKLTPSYAFVLALTCTWLRHAGSGPFWQAAVTKEVENCRTNGWANILYINNYLDNTQCMVQTWYLGAIMQLYIIGYIVCILSKGRKRQIVLAILFLFGVLTPAAHTYFQNLDAVLMVTPETARTFETNPTFNNVYKRGHTNIVNFVMGLALGFFIYKVQKQEINMKKYKKYRHLFLLTFPAIVATMFIGSVFYLDGTNAPILLKSLYAALIKPIFGIIIVLLIFSMVFKIDNIYRSILEWNVWKILSKLSYCAYLNHIFLVRAAAGNSTTLIPVDNFHMIELAITFIVLSFIAAVPIWLFVDAPFTAFLKMLIFYKKEIRTRENTAV